MRLSLAFVVSILLLQAAQSTQQAPPSAPEKEDDPGRPVLKRGGPATKHDTTPAPAAKPILREVEVNDDGTTADVKEVRNPSGAGGSAATVPAAHTRPDLELIQRAREAAYQFNEGLPNFLCDQVTIRYESETLKPSWKHKDRVDVELVYFNSREDYRNIRINGKAVKKGSPEDSGTWSSGEFGTILVDVFASNTQANFRLRGDSTASGMPAKAYDFTVAQPNSHWQVRIGSTVMPGYKGALWIDPVTARTLRVEMNTKQLPAGYAVDTVESTVDYGWVTLNGQKFLLPVKSQNLACYRGSFHCTMNEIEFRNYRKFQAESQLLQVESDITFPEEEKPKTPPAKDPKKK